MTSNDYADRFAQMRKDAATMTAEEYRTKWVTPSADLPSETKKETKWGLLKYSILLALVISLVLFPPLAIKIVLVLIAIKILAKLGRLIGRLIVAIAVAIAVVAITGMI